METLTSRFARLDMCYITLQQGSRVQKPGGSQGLAINFAAGFMQHRPKPHKPCQQLQPWAEWPQLTL